jgi:hypothetical protein
MKHLKIYFAILFFSFLGGVNPELMAQSNTCKYGDKVTVLRSEDRINSGIIYELSVSAEALKYNVKIITFKLVRVGGSTIWEYSSNSNACTSPDAIIGKGLVGYGDCVLLGGNNGQGTGTFLRLNDNGELALYGGAWYGDGDKVWSTGTCGGVLGGCGPVGSR